MAPGVRDNGIGVCKRGFRVFNCQIEQKSGVVGAGMATSGNREGLS